MPLETVVLLLVLVLDDVVEEVEAVVSEDVLVSDVVVVEEVVVADDVVLVSDGVVLAGSSLVEKNVYVGPVVGAVAEEVAAGACCACAGGEVAAGACCVCACDAGAGWALPGGDGARAEEGSVASEPLSSSTTGVEANGSAGLVEALGADATSMCLSATTGTLRVVCTV